MNAEKMIKSEAKRALSGNWPAALTSYFIMILVPIITALVAVAAFAVLGEEKTNEIISNEPVRAILFVVLNIAAVAVLVLLSPLYPGFVRAYSSAAEGKEISVADVFFFFDDRRQYKNAVSFMSGLLVKCLGIIVVCNAPALAIAAYSGDDDTLLTISGVLAAIGIIASLLWMHRFRFSVMLFSYYGYDGVSAAQTGARIAKTGTVKLLRLTLTFVPWLLTAFFGIPMLYVFPYMSCAGFVSAKYLISGYREGLAAQQQPEFAAPAITPDKAPVADTAAPAITLDKAPVADTAAPALTLDKAPVADTAAPALTLEKAEAQTDTVTQQ